MRSLVGCAIVLSVFGLAGEAGALPIPVSSEIHLVADSDAGDGPAVDDQSQSQAGTINPLAVSVDALANNGAASVDTHATMSASWTNAANGAVAFSGGWTTQNVTAGHAYLDGGLDWQYTFVADATGLFTLNWNIAASGDLFGLNGFNFSFTGASDHFLVASSAGATTRAITAGQTYTANLRNNANIDGPLGDRTASLNAGFDWNMDTANVPEPATLALLGIGLAGLAGSRRRKPS